MTIDLRLPLGALFIAIGLVMVIFGLTSDPALYERSLGINVNLWWGLVQIAFGALMLGFAVYAPRRG
jgi:hypothetical protein